MTIEYVFNFAA